MSQFRKSSRFNNDGYKRPKKTATDLLTKEQILDKLEDYEQVKDIYKVPLGTHLRYFKTMDNGERKFRLGGFLTVNTGLPKYVILSTSTNGNGGKSWSVQVRTARFYRKLTPTEIKDDYHKQLDELEDENKKFRKEIIRLNNIIKKLQRSKKYH
uniref:Uncharacterized protein n=1 Tax=Mimivirus LCMiAC01 TaxID=2506608 RepID=A0A481Z079_9VIRU|nr:MAG: uncharacterized protein LCMiAC01_03380 [Mimivirus LCMiAC01]